MREIWRKRAFEISCQSDAETLLTEAQVPVVGQFVGAKAKDASPEKKAEGWGNTRTWTALDAETELCVSYLAGGREAGWAKEFMPDCASRNRVQITTDGHRAYLEAVEDAFGADIATRPKFRVPGQHDKAEDKGLILKALGERAS